MDVTRENVDLYRIVNHQAVTNNPRTAVSPMVRMRRENGTSDNGMAFSGAHAGASVPITGMGGYGGTPNTR